MSPQSLRLVLWTLSRAETETAGGESVATQVFRRGVIKVSRSQTLDIMCHLLMRQVVSVTEDGSRTAARVVNPDIAATNGVDHAIDTVI